VATPPFDELASSEQQLRGAWIESPQGKRGDAVEQRIFWLISERLVALGSASDGWDWLYRDPRDGRLWELTYPEGSLLGRGPRQLALVLPEVAAAKYDLPGR
jgi:hypothetical protein